MLLAIASGPILLFSAYLAREADRSPPLWSQLTFLALISFFISIYFAVKAILRFSKRLVIDDDGVRMLPLISGFSVPWNEIESWELRELNQSHPLSRGLIIRMRGEDREFTVLQGEIPVNQRNQLKQALHDHLPANRTSVLVGV